MEPEKNDHIDVLMLTQHDWANSAMRYAKCLEMLGLKVVAFKGEKHPFDYPDQLPIHPAMGKRAYSTYHYIPQLKPFAEKASVLHFCTSTFIDTGVDPFEKKIVMQHGGTAYRQGPENLNEFYNHFVDATIIQCPDLLGLGAKDEQLIYYPVEFEKIKAKHTHRLDGIKIGHFPRHPQVKGTDNIIAAVETLQSNPRYRGKFEFVMSADAVSWEENLERMNKCDVIIECCKAVQGEKKFGEWGNTSLEAAALGKIVVTNSLSVDIYNKEYGPLGLQIANNKKELEQRLVEILEWPFKERLLKRAATYEWALKNHSMEATAKRLQEKIYGNLI